MKLSSFSLIMREVYGCEPFHWLIVPEKIQKNIQPILKKSFLFIMEIPGTDRRDRGSRKRRNGNEIVTLLSAWNLFRKQNET